jgi:hypothetical protein
MDCVSDALLSFLLIIIKLFYNAEELAFIRADLSFFFGRLFVSFETVVILVYKGFYVGVGQSVNGFVNFNLAWPLNIGKRPWSDRDISEVTI